MIILWWTCSVSQNECWHEEFCRSPTARPMIPNVNHIGSCLHFPPLAPHPPFRPQHEAMSAESDTNRVVLWAHPGGKRQKYLLTAGQRYRNSGWKHCKGASVIFKVDAATLANPFTCLGGGCFALILAAPKGAAVFRRSWYNPLRPMVGGSVCVCCVGVCVCFKC